MVSLMILGKNIAQKMNCMQSTFLPGYVTIHLQLLTKKFRDSAVERKYNDETNHITALFSVFLLHNIMDTQLVKG